MRFLMLFFILIFSVAASAGEIKGDWKFPSDIAVSSNKLYVVDGLNNRIAIYNFNGEHISDIEIDSPFGIYVDKKGFLYVTNQKGIVYVLDSLGNLKEKINVSGRPIDIVKIGNRLFITNGKTNTIDVYSEDGKFIKRLGGKGSAPGYFVGPFMMDRSRNLIYVVDSINARIQEFDKKGNFVRSFGVFGVEEGSLFRPKGVAFCNGNLVVTDGITGSLQLFNIYGAFEKVITKNLYYPTAVACYDKTVFVLEPLKNKVSTFKIQGVK
ncbi:NHL repeat containing protein [Desulfurobacterium thermolithotrophum DSM 11699]|uniref:NHL repeat containing protein n=1 Tax=Desulfurobacterium thermolithotrophum (strain DSM 11699 / BSA) TaxID=868864 RepID=F0S267_DESTD|nr:NHL repeat-containing protein [Desulfurobacterium thermolithotrophum]ADY73010.1 NHL repeat containing protein [Desulfurobacterium thermolithotrophum DSM 11699]